ncbi:CAF1 family protein [Dictyostelium discoideum AX4]|uniref:poly(A)-specific ribonuclease n=1 Tax=Dictyostelium discoideum TaxID=44689 RepID=Q54NG7_DICDI|nr:CAF1 family protein [Dictyostelium discoideum AX4]EAL64798.1 CAF1 family protein [Dictyostelium discoideum AX4]|eukprot:XP_638302.1 CAF1 family protein [Dictyostelium discoideum AX4]
MYHNFNYIDDENGHIKMLPSPVKPNGGKLRTPTSKATILTADIGHEIREVWAHNLEYEMSLIRELVDIYPCVAIDTEFPGFVNKPIESMRMYPDYNYQTLRSNVDLLKIIQFGITFSDSTGCLPVPTCTWQFNFKFSLKDDMYSPYAIELLKSCGIDFQRIEDYGIDVNDFSELFISSGIVLNDKIQWICFHGGYDFGYLLKVLSCSELPKSESDFFDLLRIYFPCIYDVKYLMKSCKNLKGGLSGLAEDLNVVRVGPQHQAGSDSLLTNSTFFKLREEFFENEIDDHKYKGILYGYNVSQNFHHNGHL